MIFDVYRHTSIKSGCRSHRAGSSKRIRRMVDRENGRTCPLPVNWNTFINLLENKEDLVAFLASELIKRCPNLPEDRELIVAGGTHNGEGALSSKSGELRLLHTSQEEADTRMFFHANHAYNSGYETIVVRSDDTDVLILLIHHSSAKYIWMKTGTAAEPKYLPVHEIQGRIEVLRPGILALHAMTGCDAVSQFYNIGKKTALKTAQNYPSLLQKFEEKNTTEEGYPKLSEEKMQAAEEFVCLMYAPKLNVTSVDQLRVKLFPKVSEPDKLPPTSDALKWHLLRTLYQVLIWQAADTAYPMLPSPEEYGWYKSPDGVLKPRLMIKPAIPGTCVEIIVCKCKTPCPSNCSCRKSGQPCIMECECQCREGPCNNPFNVAANQDDTSLPLQ